MRRCTASLPLIASAIVVLLTTAACGGGSSNRTASPVAPVTQATTPAAGNASTARAESDALIAFLEQRAEGDPLDVLSLNQIAAEHIQRARETGDVSSFSRAETALQRSLEREPQANYDATALLAGLRVTQHDFAQGADLAQQAIALRPRGAYAYGVLGDAHMGTGRYDDAATAYAQMATIEVSLSSHSREALLAQVRGRYDDAEAAWQSALALADGDDVPEHAAWIQSQMANLAFIRGDIDASGARYEASLAAFPGYVHALAGLGRVAAASGDLDGAAARYEEAIAAVPLPEYVIALGDVYAAQGDTRRAEERYALVEAIDQLYAANGVNLDLQLALFNADRGRDLEATAIAARAAYESQPSVQAADVLAWAAYRTGDIATARTAIDAALAPGAREPSFLFHAGLIYRAAGDDAQALAFLQELHDRNPRFSVAHEAQAQQALDELRAEASR